MSPQDQNILNVLNLLTLLFRSQKQNSPRLSPDQQHTLRVTKEHLVSNEITIAVFINTLNILSDKGYLLSVAIFEEKFHSEIREFYGDKYPVVIEQLNKLDLTDAMKTAKEKMADTFEKMKPADYVFDREEFVKSDMTFVDLLQDVKPLYENHTNDDVALVILMPFRSIDRLLKKLNQGMKFDDIQDAGIWYDSQNYLFNISDRTIPTSHQNKPNKEHFALLALFSTPEQRIIDFDDIPEFDSSNENERKAYYDALNRFLKKDSELPKIFDLHKGHLELNQHYIEHTH